MKEKTVTKDEDQLAFWKDFIENNVAQIKIMPLIREERQRSLRTYVEHRTIEIDKYENLSWETFKKVCLTGIEKLAEIVKLNKDEIIHACSSGYLEGKKELSRRKEEYLSWKEFKKIYLNEVEKLAEILGMDRKQLIKDYKDLRPECLKRQNEIDDDYKFVDEIMYSISECQNKKDRQYLLRKLKEADGAKDTFDEIYRIWIFKSYFDDELHFRKIPGFGGRRSEPGKGEIVGIYLIDESYGGTLIEPTVGEDYADCIFPIVVKVKPNSAITDEDLIRALRDLADSLEADFKNCYLPSTDGYEVPRKKEEQAILCGLYKNNPELHEAVKFNPGCSLVKTVKKAGWVNPEVSRMTGIGEALQKGWPKLYRKVVAGEMTPFEALVKTGWVHPKDVYEVCRSDKKTQHVVKIRESEHPEPEMPF